MTTSPDKSVYCLALICSARQLDSLEHLMQQAAAGQGQSALIAGEAGIGKSRLVAELKAVASQNGFLASQGNCFETDRGLPYAIILEVWQISRVYAHPESLAEARKSLRVFHLRARPPSPTVTIQVSRVNRKSEGRDLALLEVASPASRVRFATAAAM